MIDIGPWDVVKVTEGKKSWYELHRGDWVIRDEWGGAHHYRWLWWVMRTRDQLNYELYGNPVRTEEVID